MIMNKLKKELYTQNIFYYIFTFFLIMILVITVLGGYLFQILVARVGLNVMDKIEDSANNNIKISDGNKRKAETHTKTPYG